MQILTNSKKSLFSLCFVGLIAILSMPQAAASKSLFDKPSDSNIQLAAKTAVNDSQDKKEYVELLKYLKSLENRYFFHTYDHDPIEKRVERLELLVFGGSRYGVFEDRIKDLRKAVEKRDKEAASKIQAQNKASKSSGKQTQYPILNTLEWRVFKKTYQSESLDSRLERLEKKLLGQPSPAMSYADRIDRLKKIVGINITSLPPENSKLLPGPLPRANKDRLLSPFGKSFPNFNPNSQEFERDFNNQMMKDMPNMMKYMNKRMKDIFENMPEFKRIVPDEKGTPYIVPGKKKKMVIPPYADPNSI